MIPGLSVFWVIFFVLVLAFSLDRLLFKPIMRVMTERETRVRSAMDLAAQSAERAKSAAAEFADRTGAAQADVYRQMDAARKAALEGRTQLVARTRGEVEASTEQARAQLDRDADALADAVVTRVLGRKAS